MVQEFDLELVNNQEQRLPCVLILDTSASMRGTPISELNEGLTIFEQEVKGDDDASQKVQVLIISCGGGSPKIISDWTDAESFSAPTLEADGMTPMGSAVELAMQKIEERKSEYRQNGVSYLKPWLYIISDGSPNDDWIHRAKDLLAAEKSGKFTTFAIAVQGADEDILQQFSIRPVAKLSGVKFKELFQWISASVRVASQKVDDNEKVELPPVDWSSV